ncbi:MAG: molybdenum cofactor biosynthesis protein MoaE [Chromatiales bacterium]|jgi:molybdopterin synthase catalytic subunit|nr:molybdenum cofactor biosynthesis protein MoaE [Chromatiales bacterium]MDX9767718.1 molybdenum cofactor biosynthesis protein MoaE [Ectothiorhodospiraceae bacterium]
MPAYVREQAFDPWREVSEFQARELPAGRFGACASFVGTMREFNEGDDVRAMTLEHYPGMTDKYLEKLIDEAKARWPVLECLVVHRVGPMGPGDPIVLTAVWSAHRAAAFEACRYLMEELKHRAPFWKKETLAAGDERWVEQNTPG